MSPEQSKKIKFGTQHLLNPRPAILVGTYLDNKPNFITVSWAGLTGAVPPSISIAIKKIRYSLKGIILNETFSINIPSTDLVDSTDYCGCVSGEQVDKVTECKFEIFYGNTKNAPMIKQCPVNIECEVLQNIDMGDHALIIGKIIETYVSEDCVTNGVPDIKKIDPLCYCAFTQNAMGYYRIGQFLSETKSLTKPKVS